MKARDGGAGRALLLVDSEILFAEVLRRESNRWLTEIAEGPTALLSLTSVPLSISMAKLYRGIPLPEPRSRPAATG